MSSNIRLSLVKFDGCATFRSHQPDDDPIHEYVRLTIDRDRFNALGKPGYLDITISPAAVPTEATA